MSHPWKYRTVSAGREITGCETKIAEPDEDGNGEVRSVLLFLFHRFYCLITDKTVSIYVYISIRVCVYNSNNSSNNENFFFRLTGPLFQM